MEVNKYKIIISNKNIYEEIEIPIDAKVYRVGTSIESDYRLYRDAFFENVQLDFSNNNGSWMVMCSDNIYITLGDTKRLLMKTLEHGDVFYVKYQESKYIDCYVNLGNVYSCLEKYDDALENFKKALMLEEKSSTVLFDIGNIMYLKGDKIEAVPS